MATLPPSNCEPKIKEVMQARILRFEKMLKENMKKEEIIKQRLLESNSQATPMKPLIRSARIAALHKKDE